MRIKQFLDENSWLIVPSMAIVTATTACAGGLHHHSQNHHSHHELQHHIAPWWTLWNLRPEVFLILGLLTAMYWHGIRQLWQQAGHGRGISHRQMMIFLSGVAALLVALISPLDILGQQLGFVHVVQHMMLIMVAAPLLVLGSTGQALTWSLPVPMRSMLSRSYRRLRRLGMRRYVLWQPILIWTCFALVLWLLHVPELYEAALRNRFLHDLQHIAFVIAACLFWRVVLDPISSLRLNPMLGVMYLFATCLQCSAMGVFMAFSPSVWYSAYIDTTPAWGMSPLLDQQIAGYVMWIPACFIYAIAAAVIFGHWLQEPLNTDNTARSHSSNPL